MKKLNFLYPHLFAVLGFVLIAILYFYPILEGKKIYQSDIVQYTAMAKEQNDFRKSNNVEPYWTNSAFAGMPTYQLGAKYPNDFIGNFDDLLRFLPRPADYLFLYFIGFYVLLLVLKIDPLKAFFGALAFGFSTYLIVILGVGHNAKAHAIAYMPLVVAGVIMVFKKHYILGGLLTMIAVALELNANHFQMTYYLLFLLLIIGIYYIYKFIKNQELNALPKVIGVFAIALILAVGANAANLMATMEYTNFSIRGKSELTFTPDGKKKTENSALSKEYITEYSYGIAESFNLIAPRLFGGGNSESLSKESEIVKFLQQQQIAEDEYISEEQAIKYAADGMPTYWGNQPIVAAPAYIGAIVFFLCVLGLYHDKRKIKYVFLAGAIFSLVLSWGKNLSIVTDFFIDFVPMYDKFRAVSSIQVILELCIPVMAIMGLQSFFSNTDNQWKSLKLTIYTTLGLLIALFLCKGLFNFSSPNDGNYVKMYGPEFISALKDDRRSLYSADLLRSGFFMLLSFSALWLFIKSRLSQTTTIIIVGLLMVADLFIVDKNYVSSKDFVSAREVDIPYEETPTDKQIMEDKSNYRVLDIAGFLNARASYFHKSIGGYSAVRPIRLQELFDYQIVKNNVEVLNMLNVKYLIQTNDKGEEFPMANPDANGNAWFVNKIKFVKSADDEMKALDKLDSKNEVVINTSDDQDFLTNSIFQKDSLVANIKLDLYNPNHLKYTSNNPNDGFAVFSEMYYKNGWYATIDGKETKILRVDYTLRGLQIPKGKHTIEFKFEPQVVKTGGTIALLSSIGMLLLIAGGIYFYKKKIE